MSSTHNRPGTKVVLAVAAVVLVLTLGAISVVTSIHHDQVRHQSLLDFSITAKADTVSHAITASAANAIATSELATDRSHFSNYVLAGETLVPGLLQVADAKGVLWYDSNKPEDDFVLVYTAPPQSGYQYIASLVVVRASNGTISSYQVRGSNDSRDVLPLPSATP